MKRYTQGIFVSISSIIILVIGSYLYLSERSPERSPTEPVSYRLLTAGDSQAQGSQGADRPANLASSIELRPNETLLDLYNLKLDPTDNQEQQILVVRDVNDPYGYLRIIVASYSPLSRQWTRAWEGSSLATKIRTFQVQVLDLSGDYVYSIVCSGMNEKNEQTMTIFRRDSQEGGLGFTSVFSTVADLILIEETERPDSYKFGHTRAQSFDLSVWRRDAASANQLDQIRERWQWDGESLRYILATETKIAGAQLEQMIINQILDGSLATFTGFLDGIWYKESTNPLSEDGLFLIFQPEDNAIMFATGQSVEIMLWETSNLTRYGVYIASRNQSVRNLRRLINVELASPSTIEVRVFQEMRIKIDLDRRWDGRYRKMPDSLAESFRRQPAMASMQLGWNLNGSFQGSDGLSLVLDGSGYTLVRPDGQERGLFTLATVGDQHILHLHRQNGGGQDSRQSFLVERSHENREGQRYEVLLLQPGSFSIQGLRAGNQPALRLERAVD